MRGPNFKSGYCMVTKLTQTFVEFSHLHFDISFSSRDNNVTTFDTDLWEMVQIKKLQMKKYHAGILREQHFHAHRNWIILAESTGHCAVINRVYSLLRHSDLARTCPPLLFGQIHSDSINRVPFVWWYNKQMLMICDHGVELLTICLIYLRPALQHGW